MQIFIYEFTCGGGLDAAQAAPLRQEGWAMLSAVLEDFSKVDGVMVGTLLGEGFSPSGQVAWQRRTIRSGQEEEAFRKEASKADFTLVIAPEFDDVLATRCRWVEEEGGHLLGPSSSAVVLTADKLALADHLQSHGVPTPPVVPWPIRSMPAGWSFPLVVKPRYGAGSQSTNLISTREPLKNDEFPGELLAQPFVPGLAASVAWLLGPAQQIPLAPAEQLLSDDGRFHYLGGRLPLPADLAERAVRLSRLAIEAVPGLQGFVGVDLILGESKDCDRVIEINPRLTTSYLGLRQLASVNLAEALIRVIQGSQVDIGWQPGLVSFSASAVLPYPA